SQQEVSQCTQLLLNNDILTLDLQVSLAQIVQQDLPILDILASRGNSKKTAILEQQKQSHMKHLGCKWIVNASCPKTTEKIKITSCYLEHNHEIHPDTIIFASYY
ncbi:744_t:CDS:2, partial [Gigaspora margarita]